MATTTFVDTVTLTSADWFNDADDVVYFGFGPDRIANMSFAASVGSNALTVALKGNDGNDPSSTNPVKIAFRNATAGTGTFSVLTVTAATSIVVSSTSTLGTSSGVAARLWIVGFNDGGTFRLGIVNCKVSTGVFMLRDNEMYSSTAEGGAGAADSAGVIYTGTAVTTKALRILGYIEATEATAGTWATAPSKVQLMHSGVALPGSTVQEKYTVDGAAANGATTMPCDNTTPQNTEGVEFMTLAVTPSSAINILRIESALHLNSGAGGKTALALFQDTTADALASSLSELTNDNFFQQRIIHRMTAGTTSATTFKLRAGSHGAGTTYFNSNAGTGAYMNGTLNSFIRITEIMV